MPVKIYISGISGNKEVKKRQQRVLMILDSKGVEYEVIDITEPGKEDEKEFMQTNSTAKDSKHPLPPQIFYDEDYCGDYEEFDLANENDELEKFLKLVPSSADVSRQNSIKSNSVQQNGNASSREASTDKDMSTVGDLDERPSGDSPGKEEDKPKATESESGTRETGDELDSETMEESANRNEEESEDQDEEE